MSFGAPHVPRRRASRSFMRRRGWEPAHIGPSKCDGLWEHRDGWRAVHCGHPTALRPWTLEHPEQGFVFERPLSCLLELEEVRRCLTADALMFEEYGIRVTHEPDALAWLPEGRA